MGCGVLAQAGRDVQVWEADDVGGGYALTVSTGSCVIAAFRCSIPATLNWTVPSTSLR